MKALLEQLELLVKSRNPLLYLLSYEEERIRRHLARLEGLPLWTWRLTEGLRDPKGLLLPATEAPLAALDAIAEQRGPALFLMLDFHQVLGERAVVRRVRDLEAGLGGQGQALLLLAPVLVVPRELEKDLMVLDVPLPSAGEVGRILQVFLRAEGLSLEPALFERFVKTSVGLTEKELKRAYVRIRLKAGRFTEAELAELAVAKRQAIRRSRFLEFYDEVGRMDGVGGMNNLKAWLEQRALAFSERGRSFGLPEPKGVFLLGVQGCGKSLTAKAVAGLFQIPLLRLDVGALFQGSGGVEESLRDTIRIAESISPAVLWIDEIEKGFLTRGGEGASSSAFGTFLTWLQEKSAPVFVVATANEVKALPPELLRKGRFDEIFFVDLPGVHDRLAILDIHIRQRGRDPDSFDLFQCAEETEKYSGAELEQVVVEALFHAFAEDRELTTRDLQRVIRDTVPLAVTMDDRLKELREWARPRTRPATLDRRRVDYFADFQEA